MKTTDSLREAVLALLTSDGAHANFDAAAKNMPADLQGKRPPGGAHSPWEILEHLRIAQSDILEFVRNPKHVSPEFPSGYWPSTPTPPNAKAWENSVKAFRADAKALEEMASNADLLGQYAPDGQTVLRKLLLAADHNAYHLGQLVLLRQLLGAWK
jgi:DinB superfamily